MTRMLRFFSLVVPSLRHTQLCWGSQVSQHQLEQTLLHQHLNRNFSTHRFNSIVPEPWRFFDEIPTISRQYCWASQTSFCSFPVSDETFQFPIARSRRFGPAQVHFLCDALICLPKRLAIALVGFRWRSACGEDCNLLFKRVYLPKTQTRTFLFCALSDAA